MVEPAGIATADRHSFGEDAQMTDEQWQTEVRQALDVAARDKAAAARRLQQVASQCQRESARAAGEWHYEQSLGLAATLLADAGRHYDAVRLYKRLARHHSQALAGHGQSLASTQTALALVLFAAGESAAGAKAGRDAMRWAGQFGDPSVSLEKLLGEVRAFMSANAQRRLHPSKRGRRGRK
jgi:hypothetical protein